MGATAADDCAPIACRPSTAILVMKPAASKGKEDEEDADDEKDAFVRQGVASR